MVAVISLAIEGILNTVKKMQMREIDGFKALVIIIHGIGKSRDSRRFPGLVVQLVFKAALAADLLVDDIFHVIIPGHIQDKRAAPPEFRAVIISSFDPEGLGESDHDLFHQGAFPADPVYRPALMDFPLRYPPGSDLFPFVLKTYH